MFLYFGFILFVLRYLTDLDCPGDPAWDCIVNLQQWIKKLFMECKDFFQKSGKFMLMDF